MSTISEAAKGEALKLFRVVHGEGDSGDEFAFNAQNLFVIQGWYKLAQKFIDADRAARQPQEVNDPWFGANLREAIAAFAPADENIMERTPLDALNCLFYRIKRGKWKSDSAHNSTLIQPDAKDTERLNWLDYTATAIDIAGEQHLFRGQPDEDIREAIDSAMSAEHAPECLFYNTHGIGDCDCGLAAEQEKRE